MFNLVITVISIALVAVLALAGILYAGGALDRGAAEIASSSVLNQGQQLSAAAEIWSVNNNGKTAESWSDLIDTGVISSTPKPIELLSPSSDGMLAADLSWDMIRLGGASGPEVFRLLLDGNMSAEKDPLYQQVCERVARGSVVTSPPASAGSGGCYKPSDGDYRIYFPR